MKHNVREGASFTYFSPGLWTMEEQGEELISETEITLEAPRLMIGQTDSVTKLRRPGAGDVLQVR